jgi:hypothetical protein
VTTEAAPTAELATTPDEGREPEGSSNCRMLSRRSGARMVASATRFTSSALARHRWAAGGLVDDNRMLRRHRQIKNWPLESGLSLLGGQMPVGDGHATTRRRSVSIALQRTRTLWRFPHRAAISRLQETTPGFHASLRVWK